MELGLPFDPQRFYLQYEFGLHHVLIEVNKNSFEKVVDDLSMEFEIKKEWKEGEFRDLEYFVKNYYGQWQYLGCKREII